MDGDVFVVHGPDCGVANDALADDHDVGVEPVEEDDDTDEGGGVEKKKKHGDRVWKNESSR